MSNPFAVIGKVFKGIGHVFASIFGKKTAENFGKASLEMLKSELGKLVLVAVAEVSALPYIDGEQKRKEALKRIKDAAIAAGIETKDSLVNMLVELAVQFLKGHLLAE